MKKFDIKGLVFLIFYAFSTFCFIVGAWSLFGSRAEGDYMFSMLLAILSNPKVWNFIKNNLYK